MARSTRRNSQSTSLSRTLVVNLAATLGLCLLSAGLQAESNPHFGKPTIGLIIDDIGYQYERDIQSIQLPGAITYAFLPGTPNAIALADFAHQQQKEILVHVPMESIAHDALDAGAITLEMTQKEVTATLLQNLAAIPYAVGFNNHMGSLLTQHPGHMQWIMQTISRTDLFFVDSYTTEHSVAQMIANENWIPNIRRDVFLDNDRTEDAINNQFDHLLYLARKNGIALAIAHPYPQTVAVLKRRLLELKRDGYQLVFASKLIELNMQRFTTWRAFLSR